MAMNIDVMRVNVLALLITIVNMCHMPLPQLSLDRGNASYDDEEGQETKAHITEGGKLIILRLPVHSQSRFHQLMP